MRSFDTRTNQFTKMVKMTNKCRNENRQWSTVGKQRVKTKRFPGLFTDRKAGGLRTTGRQGCKKSTEKTK